VGVFAVNVLSAATAAADLPALPDFSTFSAAYASGASNSDKQTSDLPSIFMGIPIQKLRGSTARKSSRSIRGAAAPIVNQHGLSQQVYPENEVDRTVGANKFAPT
jgi:hypothetical protein